MVPGYFGYRNTIPMSDDPWMVHGRSGPSMVPGYRNCNKLSKYLCKTMDFTRGVVAVLDMYGLAYPS